MFGWFKKRSKLEKLKRRYARLMKYSFESALKDKEKSEKARKQAREIYDEIVRLSVNNGVNGT